MAWTFAAGIGFSLGFVLGLWIGNTERGIYEHRKRMGHRGVDDQNK